MIGEKPKKLMRIVLFALLLALVGTALLGAYASGAEGSSAPRDLLASASNGPAASQPACYTLDTSRPEWLGGWTVLYLPVILKNPAP
jgi:hypothetical protein